MATETGLDTQSGRRTAAESARLSDPTAGRTAVAAEWVSESARSIADPAPLGLSAFALTTFVLGLALAYGGVGQFAAGMWEFRKGNTFGATAFASYGAFWVSFWALVTFYAKSLGNDAPTAVGWYLIAWGIFTTIMFLASFRTSAALVVLFALLAATFYLLGAGELAGSTGISKTGGYVGIITAAVAWYAALAAVMSSTFGRAILPNPPLSMRKESHGDDRESVADVAPQRGVGEMGRGL
jgi:succinate-acetate transporter protein